MVDNLKKKVIAKDGLHETVYFVRHGLSVGNKQDNEPVNHDLPLTDEGRDELKQTAKYFKDNNIPISIVASSTKSRSSESAEILAHQLGATVKVDDRFAERDWGEWGNRPWQEVAKELGGMSIEERYTFVPSGGESWQAMEERGLAALSDLVDDEDTVNNVVVIVHYGWMRAIAPTLTRASKDEHETFSVETGSISAFSFESDEFDFLNLKH